MYCKHCGSVVNEDATFCEFCGEKIVGINRAAAESKQPETKQYNINSSPIQTPSAPVSKQNNSGFCCPKCGNTELQIINETKVTTSGGGYSAGLGCLGTLAFGPIGLLCGSCGRGAKTNTTNLNFFVCGKCGEKFRNPKDLKQESEQQKGLAAFFIAFGIIIGIIAIILFNASEINKSSSATGVLVISLIIPVVSIIGGLISLATSASNESIANQIFEEMKQYNPSINIFNVNSSTDKAADITEITENKSEWVCSNCQTVNSFYFRRCSSCGSTRPQPKINTVQKENRQTLSSEWICPECGKSNQSYVGTCGCGTRKPG